MDDDGSPVVYAANVSLDTSIVLSKATDALILCAADEEGIYTLQDGTITFHKATAVSVPQSLAHLLQQAQRNRIVSCLPNSSLGSPVAVMSTKDQRLHARLFKREADKLIRMVGLACRGDEHQAPLLPVYPPRDEIDRLGEEG